MASRMIEPQILALGAELQKQGYSDTASKLAGLFVLLGSDYGQSAAMLRRAAEVSDEEGPAIVTAARAIEEQRDMPVTPLGIVLQKALEATV